MKSGDGGVDLVVYYKSFVILIQCKNHATNIGRAPVQALSEWHPVTPGATREADTCSNPMKLSYEDTIVEDIKILVESNLALGVEETTGPITITWEVEILKRIESLER
ncbi:1106_t:CDS:2 [Paraglomus occultum]|uniref:1106_t:CDS:1 n=1 Tax=Paraglomus occultum TaxID=144539 RepID=A0A9N9CWB9_9GLOM|nr:1106_t:CDS:2 [Paraglomus occultum]